MLHLSCYITCAAGRINLCYLGQVWAPYLRAPCQGLSAFLYFSVLSRYVVERCFLEFLNLTPVLLFSLGMYSYGFN